MLIYLRELLSRYIFLNLNILNILEQIFQSFFSGSALSTPGRNWFPDFHDFVLLPIGNWQSGLEQDCVTRPENRLKQIQRKSLQGFKYVRAQYACFGYHVPQLINNFSQKSRQQTIHLGKVKIQVIEIKYTYSFDIFVVLLRFCYDILLLSRFNEMRAWLEKKINSQFHMFQQPLNYRTSLFITIV